MLVIVSRRTLPKDQIDAKVIITKDCSKMDALFSEENKARFARTFKQTEFEKTKLEKSEQDYQDPDPLGPAAKVRKEGKLEKRKQNREQKKEKKDEQKKDRKDKKPKDNDDDDDDEDTDKVDETVQTEDKDDQQDRTVFMGNIPITETQKTLRVFCKPFGEVESIRLRSVPV